MWPNIIIGVAFVVLVINFIGTGIGKLEQKHKNEIHDLETQLFNQRTLNENLVCQWNGTNQINHYGHGININVNDVISTMRFYELHAHDVTPAHAYTNPYQCDKLTKRMSELDDYQCIPSKDHVMLGAFDKKNNGICIYIHTWFDDHCTMLLKTLVFPQKLFGNYPFFSYAITKRFETHISISASLCNEKNFRIY